MDRKALHASWKRTSEHLQRAAFHLQGRLVEADEGGRLVRFHEFLEANELALALGELEALGEHNAAPAAFWDQLREAAAEMGLTGRARAYAERIAG